MLIENRITPVDSVNILYSSDAHPYHLKFGDAALENWSNEERKKPQLFNGNVLLFSELNFKSSRLDCICHSVPYSTFLHWRISAQKIGFHLFALPLIISSDGCPILGKMAAHTFHSGEYYSPSGSLDEGDIADNWVDPYANMVREVREETGLDLLLAKDMSGYYIHARDNKVALFKILKFPRASVEILTQVNQFVQNDPAAELEKVIAVSDIASYPDRMPMHMKPILDWYFRNSI